MYSSLKPGSLVKFSWWSNYRAPSAVPNEHGGRDWFEIEQDDHGVVVAADTETSSSYDEDSVTVLFTRINKIVHIHASMLEKQDETT